MSWLSEKVESCSRKTSLNLAIAAVIVWTSYGATAIFKIVKYIAGHDGFYLYAGVYNLFMSIFMIWFFVGVLHAVVRRMASQLGTDAAESARPVKTNSSAILPL